MDRDTFIKMMTEAKMYRSDPGLQYLHPPLARRKIA